MQRTVDDFAFELGFDAGQKFLLGFDLSRYVMEGMAISFLTHKETERDQRVLRYLEEKLKELVGEDR